MSQPSAAPEASADRSTAYQASPSGETVKGGSLLVAAYAFVWVVVLIAVVRVFMRQSAVQKKVEELEKAIDKAKKMTFEHVIFIPSVLLAGIAIGWSLGASAVRKEIARRQAKLRE